MSVAVRLTDDIDVGRGSTIVRTAEPADRREPLRGAALLDVRAAADASAGATSSSTRRARRWSAASTCATASTSRRLHRDEERRRRSSSTTSRACTCELSAPLVFDSYRRNRVDRQPDRDRRGDQRNGRRRRDPRHRGRGGPRTRKTERSPNVRWQGTRDDARAALERARATAARRCGSRGCPAPASRRSPRPSRSA